LIRVVPAFAGLTGDYDLYVNLQRESTASLNTPTFTTKLHPNPATNLLTLSSEINIENALFQIHAISGALCLEGNLNAQNQINIEHLASGLYVLGINSVNGVQHIQFIKE
jgi:hypothetical protein